jgi:hypothetical protein
MQRKWYRSVLEKDIDAVNGEWACFRSIILFLTQCLHRFNGQEGGKDTSNEYGYAGMSRMDMLRRHRSSHLPHQLRKVTCHPYLFDGAVRLIVFQVVRFSW